MREILFRGLHPCDGPDTIVVDGEKVKGRWVQGYFFQIWERTYIVPNMIEILPSTVGQYTGLKDKNGNRIWENDVVSINTYDYMEPEEDFFGKVIYAEGWGCWCIQQPDSEKPIPLCECEGTYQTDRLVEGNIFDNPELLKGDQSCTDL